jgi:uncharacterized membrane protein YbaN (DUF454 family)
VSARTWLYKGFGVVCVGLAVVGAWLPLLPSTPFLLLAAWAFAKSSPTLHAKLRADPRFGPALQNWEDYGAISPKTKVVTVATMAASLVVLWLTTRRWQAVALTAAVMACSAAYVLSRPSGPKALEEEGGEG